MYLFNVYSGLIPIVCVACFIVLLVIFFTYKRQKKKFKVLSILLIPILLFGIYLVIPFYFIHFGVLNENIDKLNNAIKYSLFPFQKKEAYFQLGEIYMYGKDYTIFDGNIAIDCYEKAINGDYTKNSRASNSLARLYLYKGNYDKVIEIESISNPPCKINSIYAYIMQGKIKEALDVYKNSTSRDEQDEYLKVELHNILGQREEAKKQLKIAEEAHTKELNANPTQYALMRHHFVDTVAGVKKTMAEYKEVYKF